VYTLKTPPANVLRAMSEIKNTADFSVVKKWIEEEKKNLEFRIVFAQGDEVQQIQGALYFIHFVMSTIENSREMLEKKRR